MESKQQEATRFYGGQAGAWIPLGTLLCGIIFLTVVGKLSLRTFWVAGFAALCMAFLFSKSKEQFSKTAIQGLHNPVFTVLCPCFLLAGILSYVLRQSGLINGLLWLSMSLNLNAGLLPLITFLTAALISTACGTSNGTVASVTPIMFPLAMAMGCNPALVLGAIISGGAFGDNLSPISDTTIAASYIMESEVGPVVKERLKYTITAGVLACVLFTVFGLATTVPVQSAYTPDGSHALTLLMLLVPALMVFLMIKGMELIPTLMICNLSGIAICLIMGFFPATALLDTKGPIISGIDGMVGIIIFVMFLFILLQFTEEGGAFASLMALIERKCKTPRQAECLIVGITTCGVFATATNSPAMVLVGPFVHKLMDAFGLDRRRCANMLSGTACAVAGMLPYASAMLLMYSLAMETGLLPSGFSVVMVPKYSFHCICMWLVYATCAFTGLWRNAQPLPVAVQHTDAQANRAA